MPKIDQTQMAKAIVNCSIFKSLNFDVAYEMAGSACLCRFNKGELIIQKGAEGNAFYLIVGGQVRIHDDQIFIAGLETGDFFGELALLDSSPRSMSVSAESDTILMELTREHFWSVLKAHPEVMMQISAVLVQRLRQIDEKAVQELRNREIELKRQVDEKTSELRLKNELLEKLLDELERTRDQVIVREKLVALGQLVSGVAHEVQNPLNFINNFSDNAKELADELIKSSAKENDDIELLTMIQTNLSKIREHGHRIDRIVKSLMQHSRTNEGETELVDVNALCKEYVLLAESSFRKLEEAPVQVSFEFDESLAQVWTRPADLSKVLFNLVSNAIHAIDELPQAEASIKLRTFQEEGAILIELRDNGVGVAAKNADKIFQPFFSTRPNGVGVGLGLALGYNMMKSLGGDLKLCHSKPGDTCFCITLPTEGSGPN